MATLLRLWIWANRHAKWLAPFAAAVVLAAKPLVLGTDYGLHQWLAASSLVCAAVVTYIVPNAQAGVAKYAKGIVVVVVAGIGAAQTVPPGHWSHAATWSVAAAVFAALGTLVLPTTAAQVPIGGGPGRMGDSWRPLAAGGPVTRSVWFHGERDLPEVIIPLRRPRHGGSDDYGSG